MNPLKIQFGYKHMELIPIAFSVFTAVGGLSTHQ